MDRDDVEVGLTHQDLLLIVDALSVFEVSGTTELLRKLNPYIGKSCHTHPNKLAEFNVLFWNEGSGETDVRDLCFPCARASFENWALYNRSYYTQMTVTEV